MDRLPSLGGRILYRIPGYADKGINGDYLVYDVVRSD
jgi:hypothetical protein